MIESILLESELEISSFGQHLTIGLSIRETIRLQHIYSPSENLNRVKIALRIIVHVPRLMYVHPLE